MRKAYPSQLRFDTVPIQNVALNLECRDSIVPVLRALQHVYANRQLTTSILNLIADDIVGDSRTDTGREGMDYWHICVLVAVRLGCKVTYDQLQDLAENHRSLRAIMGLGECDEDTFHHKTLRNNFCLLKPETVDRISHAIVQEGHALEPAAIEKVRADSFVMETSIHYPTESSLLRDGLRKLIEMCVQQADEYGLTGWRQHAHVLKKVKKLDRKINRIASKKGPNYRERMKPLYRELLQKAKLVTQRARDLCDVTGKPQPCADDLFGPNTLQAFIVRTERVADTARRRVINGESVPSPDKLFSVFEPHTQLYKRGKAGQPIQFGRQVLVFEDAAGFIVHGVLMNRDEGDQDVAVQQLGLPEGEFSYLFQNWSGRFFVRNAYGDTSSSLVDLLGVKVSVDSLESMNLRLAADVESFREQQPAPPAAKEGELLVLSADATGVPMAHRGGQMQMAYIGAAYTVDRFVRTAQDVLDEVLRKQSSKGRPRPQFKRLYADMTRPADDDSEVTLDGRVDVFSWLAHERQTRTAGDSQQRPVICLMDGEHKLWERKEQLLGEDVVEILDFWHFLERLREVSKLLCNTDATAETFVKERLARVLDGDLGRVIGGLRQMLKKRRLGQKRPLSKKSCATNSSAITYFENNRSRMRYGDYLREGYPIASGIIEGSCRLVVEDRLDRTGMRWSLEGALAMLANRTTSLSDDWNDYQTFRITREQKRLYPTAT